MRTDSVPVKFTLVQRTLLNAKVQVRLDHVVNRVNHGVDRPAGAGTMGNGIAHTFAQFGFEVALFDINGDALSKAIQTITSNLDRQVKKEIIDEKINQN